MCWIAALVKWPVTAIGNPTTRPTAAVTARPADPARFHTPSLRTMTLFEEEGESCGAARLSERQVSSSVVVASPPVAAKSSEILLNGTLAAAAAESASSSANKSSSDGIEGDAGPLFIPPCSWSLSTRGLLSSCRGRRVNILLGASLPGTFSSCAGFDPVIEGGAE